MSLLKAIRNALSSEKAVVSSGEKARQRLHILLINDRSGGNGPMNTPDYLPQLRVEIIEVLRKYLPIVNSEDLEINYSNTDDAHILEMSISIDNDDPDKVGKQD